MLVSFLCHSIFIMTLNAVIVYLMFICLVCYIRAFGMQYNSKSKH